MKPAAFEYHRPESLGSALTLLAERADAKPLAGGQSLIPAMNFRLATPSVLVDLNRLSELAGISERGKMVRIGALTRHRAVERDPIIRRRAPLLSETMPHIAHPQIRTRGTMGGSLAHADPAAELPAVMIALDAGLVLQRAGGERRLGATDFFTGLFQTALEPGELIVAVEVPFQADRTGAAFEEFSRRHGDYALVGVAVTVTLDEAGSCAGARIALLSVGEGPVLATRAMERLRGSDLGAPAIESAAAVVAEDIEPPSDIHASQAYRRQLARVLTGRALARATLRARGGTA